MSLALTTPSRTHQKSHRRGSRKIPQRYIQWMPTTAKPKQRPDWIRTKLRDSPRVEQLRALLRTHRLHTVCEEAKCPNLNECFSNHTATFMILGDLCTRRCAFCDVAHGHPAAPDPEEPLRLARLIKSLQLNYVVFTSVDRDDLKDGGAGHFASCIQSVRETISHIRIEILVPDFKGKVPTALSALSAAPCDVFNHNLETVPRLYRAVRRGADYQGSLNLLKAHKQHFPKIPTKSGLMLGLGETLDEVLRVMQDLATHQVDRLTIGQYLQPGAGYWQVQRYWSPKEFEYLEKIGYTMGFKQINSGPLVRSSYHAGRNDSRTN